MPSYLLDTDTFIFLDRGDRRVLERIHDSGDEFLFLSSVTVAELYYGCFNARDPASKIKKLERALADKQILNFNKNTAKTFGRLRSDLAKKHVVIADMDLAIASIAMYHRCVLVTHNVKHFAPIPTLHIEDWTQ